MRRTGSPAQQSIRSLCFLSTLAVSLLSASAGARAQDAATVVDVVATATLEHVGVVVLLGGDDDADAGGRLEWGLADAELREGHPLVRVAGGRLAGTVFGLTPASAYRLRVTVEDPDGTTDAVRELSVSTRAMPARSLSGRTIIVAPGGSDTAEGTASSPFATITHAVSQAVGGDTILVRRGAYSEQVVIRRSGEPAAPIAIVAEMGTVLDGSYPELRADSAWESGGRGLWRATLDAEPAYVAIDDQRLFRFADEASLRAGRAGIERGGWAWDATRGQIAIELPDGLNPGVTDVRVGRFAVGILAEGAHDVWIQDLEIRYFGSEGTSRGVVLRDCERFVLRDLLVHHVATGLEIDGGRDHFVEGTEIHDRGAAGWPPSIVEGTDAESAAIVLTGDVGPGHVLRDLSVHGYYRGIEPCVGAGSAGEVDITGSLFFDLPSAAVSLGASCVNVRVIGNRMIGVHAGLAMRPGGVGPAWAIRNVVVPGGTLAETEGRAASALDTSASGDAAGTVLLYHNTVRTAAAETPALSLASGAWALVAGRNNVFAGTSVGIELAAELGALDLDYDAMATLSGPLARSGGGADTHGDVGSLFAAVGIEEHGVGGDPGFATDTMGDPTLAPTSPLVDRGIPVPGIDDDSVGAGPDIGAHELGALDGGTSADGGIPGRDGGIPARDAGGGGDDDGGAPPRPDAGPGGAGGGSDGGCGCDVPASAPASTPPAFWLGLGVVAAASARRRRRGDSRERPQRATRINRP